MKRKEKEEENLSSLWVKLGVDQTIPIGPSIWFNFNHEVNFKFTFKLIYIYIYIFVRIGKPTYIGLYIVCIHINVASFCKTNKSKSIKVYIYRIYIIQKVFKMKYEIRINID